MYPRVRLFFYLTTSLTFICLCQFLYTQDSSNFQSSSSGQQRKPVHLLVVSSWRSGSSFIGQIFNHHDDVFYFFEPGHSVWLKFHNEGSEILHYPVRDLLRSLFTCDVTPLKQYLPRTGNLISEIGFFAESRALCTQPICSSHIPSEGYDRLSCYHRCRHATLDKMAEGCRSYSHVVMKTVRILDLSVLLPLFRDPALDLRILHLVRDPRAVALSRKSFVLNLEDNIVLRNEGVKNVTINRVMKKICKAQVDINNVAKAAEALQGRYMAIRHEDIVSQPLESIKKIYNFADLSITKELEEWVYKITHTEEEGKYGIMPFSRDSSKVVQKWRTGLDFRDVNEIQENCKEAMDLFGYLPAKSKAVQKNLRHSLVDKEWSVEQI